LGEYFVLKAIPRQKIRDIVVERLKNYITSGDLKPGDRLPNETELAATFGVSRLSLREATKGLELFGIVESKTGVGLTLGQVSMERVAGTLGFHPALQSGSLSELVDTRVVVETGALPYAARRIADKPELYEGLCELIEQFRATNVHEERIDLDIAFHRGLLDASGLAPLVAFNDLLQIFFTKFRESVKSIAWQGSIESHQSIIDALRDQNVTKASDELRRHIESHRNRMGADA
jgi:DNA-binding FadR family transcriptional regulator